MRASKSARKPVLVHLSTKQKLQRRRAKRKTGPAALRRAERRAPLHEAARAAAELLTADLAHHAALLTNHQEVGEHSEVLNAIDECNTGIEAE